MLKKLGLIVLLLCLAGTSVSATDYYFSNCASGGAGTSGDPYCIDPPDAVACVSSGDVWAAAMSDGCGTEAVAGDNIILCISGCGAAGQAATVNVRSSVDIDPGAGVAGAWIQPTASGTAGNPITIKPFCTGGVCDDVSLKGDYDNDGVDDTATDIRFWFTNQTASDTSFQYWTIDGNPLIPLANAAYTDARYLHFLYSANNGMWFQGGGSANNGPGHVIWKHFEMAYTDQLIWSGGSFNAECGGISDHYVFQTQWNSGDWTEAGLLIHHACGYMNRMINLCGDYDFNILASEVYNTGEIMDPNNFSCSSSLTTINVARNYCHDCQGIALAGENIRNVYVEDNIFECAGVWDLKTADKCGVGGGGAAMSIHDDSCGSSGDADFIYVRRNKIYGLGEQGVSQGIWNTGAINSCFNGSVANPTIVIENNMMWHLRHFTTSASFNITANKPFLIQNNTLYDTTFGMSITGADHTVRNNIIVKGNGNEFTERDTVAGSYTFNNFHSTTGGEVVCENYNGSTCGTSRTCAQVSGFGTSNKCAAPVFVKCDSATWCADSSATSEEQWDLHLHSTDTADKDAGTTGATDDIDQDSRPINLVTDIGADEIASGDVTAPSTVSDLAAGSPTYGCLTLTWTAPGDDAGVGTAWGYDIRVASSAIGDDMAYDAATPTSGEPDPVAAGGSETFQFCNLASGTTYHFALKTTDESGNVSAVSNSPNAATASPPVIERHRKHRTPVSPMP